MVPLSTAEPFVESAAEIGVILLLLTLGLEFSATELFASLRRHGPSGIVDLVLNAPPGFVVGAAARPALARVRWRWPGSPGSPRPASSRDCSATWAAWPTARPRRCCPCSCSRTSPWRCSCRCWSSPSPVAGRSQALAGAALAVGAVLLVLLAAHRHGHRLGRLLAHADDEQVLLRLVGLDPAGRRPGAGGGCVGRVGAFLVGIAVPAVASPTGPGRSSARCATCSPPPSSSRSGLATDPAADPAGAAGRARYWPWSRP